MRTAAFTFFAVLLVAGCSHLPLRPTQAWALGPDGNVIGLSHDPSVKAPPQASSHATTDRLPIPAGSQVEIVEQSTPAAAPQAAPSVTKTVTVRLPLDKGTELITTRSEAHLSGSQGYSPPPPPTPSEKALSVWTYVGAGVFLLGAFFCTPWGGSNFRAGAIIAVGGVAMAAIASVLDQLKLPPWTPAVGLVSLVIAGALYWGYKVHEKHVSSPSVS